MGTTIPVDVAAFLAELGTVTDEMIDRYYTASEEDNKSPKASAKSFHYFAPITIEVRTSEGILARYTEEGINLYPEEEK